MVKERPIKEDIVTGIFIHSKYDKEEAYNHGIYERIRRRNLEEVKTEDIRRMWTQMDKDFLWITIKEEGTPKATPEKWEEYLKLLKKRSKKKIIVKIDEDIE